MPGLFGDAVEYGRGLLSNYDKWPGLIAQAGRAAADQLAQGFVDMARRGLVANEDFIQGRNPRTGEPAESAYDRADALAQFVTSNMAGGGPRGSLGAGPSFTDPIKRVANPIRAYHASPHSFDYVDLSKVGTGQGSQSYGHGFYAAESPAVSGRGGSYDQEFTAKRLGKYDLNQAESRVLKMLGEGKSEMEILTDLGRGGASFDEASQILESIKANKSHIYDLNIHADPQRFLDWDKPLSGQSQVVDALRASRSPKVREMVSDPTLFDANRQLYGKDLGPLTGQDIYKRVALATSGGSVVGSHKTATAFSKAGIPGIRYLDQGSRGGGGPGTSNYVVFDPSIIEIIRKYGIAAPVATAATGGLLGDEY